MSKKQAEAYLASGNLFKDLVSKATESGYDVTEEDFSTLFNVIDEALLDNVTGGDAGRLPAKAVDEARLPAKAVDEARLPAKAADEARLPAKAVDEARLPAKAAEDRIF